MKIKKGVLIQEMGRTFVAYDNQASVMHELNEVGYIILSLLEKGKTKEQILKRITEEFKITRGEAKKDLEAFIQTLEKADLIAGKK